MRKEFKKIRPSEKVATEAALTAALKKLDNNAEDFINSLLTERERFTIGRRVLIANLILSGYTRMEIDQWLNVSPNTFAKIKRWLDEALPSFETTNEIERVRLNINNKVAAEYPNPLSFAALMKRYPLDFLLFKLSKDLIDQLKS